MRCRLLQLLVLLSVQAFGQVGGGSPYAFLEVPASARIAALGGTYITVQDHDINAALQAPSLLNASMDKSIAFSMTSLFDGVRFGDATFVTDRKKLGTFSASMHYGSYGDFKLTNEYGDVEGSFKAADYCLGFGWGYRYNPRFSVGAALKTVYNDYYLYNSFSLAADLSATYLDTANNFTATIVARNAGFQLDPFVDGVREDLPVEVLAGFSKRLAHTPLRFNVTYRHLERFELRYTDPYDLTDLDPLTGEAQVREISFGNNLLRHFIISSELLLSRNFHLRAAYNFQRRQELVVDTRPSTVGFSLGFGLRISKFVLSYGRAKYHLAGASNFFSVTMNLADFAGK
ncbi:MAG: hypothetical protein RL213_261 [Bacteroidota bacterium]|jgi:hypothetical protein